MREHPAYRKLTHPARRAPRLPCIPALFRTLILSNDVVAFRQRAATASHEFPGKRELFRRGTRLANSRTPRPFASFLQRHSILLRSLLIIAAVAAISTVLSQLESAHSQMPTASPAWVRTIDGWEPSSVLTTDTNSNTPSLHPFVVAGFQLGASVFVLIAFPYRKSR